MFKFFVNAWIATRNYLGLTDDKYRWKWTGKAGAPSWNIRLADDKDIFVYEATLTPSTARPTRLGTFIRFDERNSHLQVMRIGNQKLSYLPRISHSSLVERFREMGMSRRKAEKSAFDEIRHEMLRTEAYEAGTLTVYRLVICVKSDNQVLATDIVDCIEAQTDAMMCGTDRRVIGMILNRKEELRSSALVTLRFLKKVSADSSVAPLP